MVGYLYRGFGSTNNARLEMSFSESYKDYAEFLGDLFKKFYEKSNKMYRNKR
jgi:hypothetical protein